MSDSMEEHRRRPRVLIVGGPDVDQRLELMKELGEDYELAAAGSDRSVATRFGEAGFAFHYYPLSRSMHPVADIGTMVALARLVRRVRPDIVHAFATKPSVWGRLAASISGAPVVVGTLPGLGSLFSSSGLRVGAARLAYLRLQKLACKRSALTIFQNHGDRDELIARGVVTRDRSTVIVGSGVRTSELAITPERREAATELRRSLDIDPEAVVVTMVSRIIRPKGVLEFAEAARTVTSNQSRATFLLAGPDDRDSLHSLDRLELDTIRDSVRWLGERNDVPDLLAASDLFVLPTYYREGVPRVLLEAAATGLPLVATDTPGCREVVRDGDNGFLVPPRDPAALASAIQTLVADRELRRAFGESSRELAHSSFDLRIVAKRTAEEYRRLLVRNGAC